MASTSPALVLLVDDDPTNLSVLSEALAGQPWSVAVAIDGEMALERVQQEIPDLILLDAMMPGMDGFEVCRRLKADPATREIPILFMTALADTANRVRGFNVGAIDYLTKPFEREELLARVKTQLSLRAAVKALSEKNTDLEREVEERRAAQVALSHVVQQLERAQQDLLRGRDALEIEVSRRTEDLQEAKQRVETELAERRRAEAERAALQEQIIEEQAARLAELSTPIIPISDAILVMPLIGAIDEERAERVLQAALRRVTESRAQVMILDITGVSRVDERVAAAILRVARALRLVGSRAVLTGIRPDVAQVLVGIYVDFSDVVTQVTLQAGIAYAMARLSGAGARRKAGARMQSHAGPRNDEEHPTERTTVRGA